MPADRRHTSNSIVKRWMTFALLALGTAAVVASPVGRPAYDPVAQDDIVADPAYPPKTVDANFQSAGVGLTGSIFCAQGKGPHPTLLYARGFPDQLASSDILRVLRRAGYNVMSFYYRGTYGLGGVYSMQHSYEDLQAAVAFLRQESSVRTMGVDPNNIIPYGYSFGGPIALRLAAEDPNIHAVMLQDPTDLRPIKSMTSLDRKAMEDEIVSPLVPSANGKQILDEIVGQMGSWDPAHDVEGLSGKHILLAWASRGNEIDDKAAHADSLGALLGPRSHVSATVFDTDHGFTDKRIALTRDYLQWLKSLPAARVAAAKVK
jgi:uncharacterized protein